MVREIQVGNNKIKMKATALTPLLYRTKFGRDIFKDMEQLTTAVDSEKSKSDINENDTGEIENSSLTIDDLTVFEKISFVMARQGDTDENGNRLGNIPDTLEGWLDGIDGIFSVYEALPQIIELWGDNIIVNAESKKKIK